MFLLKTGMSDSHVQLPKGGSVCVPLRGTTSDLAPPLSVFFTSSRNPVLIEIVDIQQECSVPIHVSMCEERVCFMSRIPDTVQMSVYPSLSKFIHFSLSLSVSVHLFICPFVHLSICPFVYVSICLSIDLCVFLSVCMHV